MDAGSDSLLLELLWLFVEVALMAGRLHRRRFSGAAYLGDSKLDTEEVLCRRNNAEEVHNEVVVVEEDWESYSDDRAESRLLDGFIVEWCLAHVEKATTEANGRSTTIHRRTACEVVALSLLIFPNRI